MIAIYRILNLKNRKSYIGSSFNLKARWYQHRSYLNRNIHPNKKLQNGWNKYGEECFVFGVIEEIEQCDKNYLEQREQYWIDTLQPWYNIREEAKSNKGSKFNDTSKMKEAAKVRNKKVHNVKVLLYNLDGSFDRVCCSMKEAAPYCKVTQSSSVSNCMRNMNQGKCGDRMVKPYKENYPLQIEPYKRTSHFNEEDLRRLTNRAKKLYLTRI